MSVVHGIELEFALTGVPHTDREAVSSQLVQRVAASQPHAWGACVKHSRAAFLASGAAFGLDPPAFVPEFCTPECLDPFELAASLNAGMRLIARAARELSLERGRRLMPVAASNFYQAGRATLGNHENYGVRLGSPFTFRHLVRAILPWIVLRQPLTEPGVLSGAQGSNGFALSPRATYMVSLLGSSTTGPRAIVTTGRSAHAGSRWVRLHIIPAGATLSPWAIVVRHGVTALLLEMALRGWEPPQSLTPSFPVEALRAVSLAPERPIQTGRGLSSPLDLLERLLCEVRRIDDRNPLTPWSGRVLAEWEWGMTMVRDASPDAEMWIESRFRRRLLDGYLKRAGLSWEQVELWSHILDRMDGADLSGRLGGLRQGSGGRRRPLSRSLKAEIERCLRERGYNWDDVPRYRHHIERLRALDIELSRVDEGIAERQREMRRELGLEIISGGEVARAETEPPARTRARARGFLIALLAGKPGTRACWDVVRGPGYAFSLANPLGWRLPRGAGRLAAAGSPAIPGWSTPGDRVTGNDEPCPRH